ncbi:MAG: hypothetical protein LAP87_01045 [Acidobacteriia bacterium]|nr:hypothetical protein [Terriglobia bacterium]
MTGQSALWKMYQAARSWAPDAQVLKLNSIRLAEVPQVPGKAAAWQATFTSDAKSRARSYTYSVIESAANLHKDVFAGLEEGWSGPHGSSAPFLIAAVKIDTDAAYQTALGNGGSDYDKKDPGKTITLLLEKTTKFPDPAWRVIWGESAGTANFSVYVDASTGGFLEKMH